MTSLLTSLLQPRQIAHMKTWSVQDAKARFSELLDDCVQEGPQLVSKRGIDAAVLVPIDAWNRLQYQARPTLKNLLLSDAHRTDLPIPPRGGLKRRTPP
jgi:prevent-host-death family protein